VRRDALPRAGCLCAPQVTAALGREYHDQQVLLEPDMPSWAADLQYEFGHDAPDAGACVCAVCVRACACAVCACVLSFACMCGRASNRAGSVAAPLTAAVTRVGCCLRRHAHPADGYRADWVTQQLEQSPGLMEQLHRDALDTAPFDSSLLG
jgi:hypothetical protein